MVASQQKTTIFSFVRVLKIVWGQCPAPPPLPIIPAPFFVIPAQAGIWSFSTRSSEDAESFKILSFLRPVFVILNAVKNPFPAREDPSGFALRMTKARGGQEAGGRRGGSIKKQKYAINYSIKHNIYQKMS